MMKKLLGFTLAALMLAGCACAETTLQTAAQAKTIGRFMFGE